MDLGLVIAALVVLVLLIVINIYMLAYYCHPDDEFCGFGLFCKILVVNFHHINITFLRL